MDAVLLLMGTKLDLVTESSTPRQVSLDEAKGFASTKHIVDVIETSSKEDKNIKLVFLKLAKELQKKHKGLAGTVDDPTDSIRVATTQLPNQNDKNSIKQCVC